MNGIRTGKRRAFQRKIIFICYVSYKNITAADTLCFLYHVVFNLHLIALRMYLHILFLNCICITVQKSVPAEDIGQARDHGEYDTEKIK